MDTKLKNNKLAKYILFFMIVGSLAVVLLQLQFHFKIRDNYLDINYNKEFYKSGLFDDYMKSTAMSLYSIGEGGNSEIYNGSVELLKEQKNIRYIVVNNSTNEVQSNTVHKSISDFKKSETGYYVEIEGENSNINMRINNEEFIYDESRNNIGFINSIRNAFSNYEKAEVVELKEETEEVKVLNSGISIYAVLPEVPKEIDYFRSVYLENEAMCNTKNDILVISIIALIILIVSIVISKRRGYKFINSDNRIYKTYDKMWLEFKVIFIVIPIIFDTILIERYNFYNGLSVITRISIVDIIASIGLKIVCITAIYMSIQNTKYVKLLKNSISYKVFKVIRKSIKITMIASRKIGLIKRIIILSFISIILMNIVIYFISILLGIYSYLMLTTTLIVGIVSGISFVIFTSYIVSKLGYLNEIMEGVNKIENGDINYKIEVKGNDSFTSLAESINNIGNGLDNAIEERMKSETMKSELITNVSHDLKTPLTSILNYVDLLKKEDVKQEHLNDYIAILDQKSKRLKVLIEDLFEAAKATSGTVELNIEKIQLNQLLTQSIAEMEGKIIEANLDMKVNFPEDKVYINADGKKIFRVFENLISNIVKYSLSNTRVYIDFCVKDDYADITFKNISAYELNFNDGEITERFKRGDSSRSEEGSGLGLSIAKGLVELQGGEFIIQTDGDLFKAIVKLKLSKEEDTVI